MAADGVVANRNRLRSSRLKNTRKPRGSSMTHYRRASVAPLRFAAVAALLAVAQLASSADPPRGLITLEIRYQIRTTNTFYNLVYPFYVQEGSNR